jgi:hypothetical protein
MNAFGQEQTLDQIQNAGNGKAGAILLGMARLEGAEGRKVSRILMLSLGRLQITKKFRLA